MNISKYINNIINACICKYINNNFTCLYKNKYIYIYIFNIICVFIVLYNYYIFLYQIKKNPIIVDDVLLVKMKCIIILKLC